MVEVKERSNEAITFEVRLNRDALNNLLAAEFSRQLASCSYEQRVYHDAIKDACRSVVYENKDEIVERVVKQAVTEIKRKALPKLLERMDAE